jgi:hypothetical protein
VPNFNTIEKEKYLLQNRDLGTDDVIAYITDEHNFLSFSESLKRLILKDDPAAEVLWNEDVIHLLFDKFDNAGIEYLEDTIRDWVNKNARPKKEEGYGIKLCFAFDGFKGNPESADDFLQRDCYLDGLSPREPNEIIVWHSIAKSYTYEQCEELISQYNDAIYGITPAEADRYESIHTKVLVSKFFSNSAKKNDDTLISDLVDFYSTGKFGRYRKTAHYFFTQDKEQILNDMETYDDNDNKRVSYRKLMNLLFPRPERKKKCGISDDQQPKGIGEPRSYKESKFPKDIYKGIPNKGDLSNFEKGKVPVSRKALILLYFSVYSQQIWTDNEGWTMKQWFDDFRTKMNMRLSQSGMYELYHGNPFDMMIMFCAYSEEPDYFFEDLIQRAYNC